jgi:hypothetical protein
VRGWQVVGHAAAAVIAAVTALAHGPLMLPCARVETADKSTHFFFPRVENLMWRSLLVFWMCSVTKLHSLALLLWYPHAVTHRPYSWPLIARGKDGKWCFFIRLSVEFFFPIFFPRWIPASRALENQRVEVHAPKEKSGKVVRWIDGDLGHRFERGGSQQKLLKMVDRKWKRGWEKKHDIIVEKNFSILISGSSPQFVEWEWRKQAG